jgi:uncharacterized protein (TIGR00255 family)
MSMASMTGFARETGATGRYRWAWEIRSVNARGLDVRLRTPPGFDALGEAARQALAKALARGTCHVNLTLDAATDTPRLRINEEALKALVETLSRLDVPADARNFSLDGLLAVRGIIETGDTTESEDERQALEAELRAGLERAVRQLREARAAEGQALSGILLRQLDEIARLQAAAEACPARTSDAIKARLREQVAALMETGATLDPQRLHQEAVLMAAKADIREELDRLAAHVAAARVLIGEGGAIGRRLDFLAQEFSREANTLCAKANDVTLSAIGLDLKTVVEQFREQVQNVE